MAVNESDKIDMVLYCDGACRGNPGPSSYGVVARLSNHTEIGHGGMFIGSATNNEAEWQGAIAAIQFARNVVESPTGSAITRVIIRMDSMLVVKQMTGQWKIKEPRLKPFHTQGTSIVRAMNVLVVFQWVPREENGDADRIANQCLDERSTVGVSLTVEEPSNEHTKTETSDSKQNKKNRRIQFLIDEDSYAAFQHALRAKRTTATEVLVSAVKCYLEK